MVNINPETLKKIIEENKTKHHAQHVVLDTDVHYKPLQFITDPDAQIIFILPWSLTNIKVQYLTPTLNCMRRNVRNRIFCNVRPTKTQTCMCIRAV